MPGFTRLSNHGSPGPPPPTALDRKPRKTMPGTRNNAQRRKAARNWPDEASSLIGGNDPRFGAKSAHTIGEQGVYGKLPLTLCGNQEFDVPLRTGDGAF